MSSEDKVQVGDLGLYKLTETDLLTSIGTGKVVGDVLPALVVKVVEIDSVTTVNVQVFGDSQDAQVHKVDLAVGETPGTWNFSFEEEEEEGEDA